MRWGAPVLAAVLLLGACGGDDAIAKDDLIEQGDEICTAQQPEARRSADAAASDRPGDEAVREVLLPALRDMFQEVRDLGTPADDEETIGVTLTRLVELLDQVIEGGALESFAGAYEPLVGELRAYGFEVCGQG